MDNNIVANKMINFNDIEMEVFGFVCEIGVSMIKDILKKLKINTYKQNSPKI